MVLSTDKLLVERIRQGDAKAWQQLIDRYEGRMLAFVSARLNDRTASEDVVQETFLGLLTSLAHFDESRDLSTYLFSIAAHKLTDHLRRQGRRPWDTPGESDAVGRPLDEMPGRGRRASSIVRSGEHHQTEQRVLADALGQLIRQWISRGQWERLGCMELLWVRGWPNKQVATQLKMSEQAVANYKHQTITQLQRLVRKAGLKDESILEFS